ncbi:MAG: hypothetical protein QM673_17055 [Gordonia sp. (in: high G+C Gram-positive bacteria)]
MTSTRILTRRAGRLIAAVVLVAVVAAACGVAVVAKHVLAGSAVLAARADLRDQAATIVRTVFTVHADRWRAERRHARTLVGGDFAATYGADLDSAPQPPIISIDWRPEVAGVVDATATSGEVLLRASVVTARTGRAPSTEQRDLLAFFDRVEGRWLLTGTEVIG